MIAKAQCEDKAFAGYYNVGPEESDCIITGKLVDLFCKEWGNLQWINQYENGPHEANFLKLDCSKLKRKFGWKPRWSIADAIKETVAWTKVYVNHGNISQEMKREIVCFEGR